MRIITVDRKPHLCLFAIKDIRPGEEITYNYGDSDWPWRLKVATEAHPHHAAWASDCTKDVEQLLSERESPVMSPVPSCPDKTLVKHEYISDNIIQVSTEAHPHHAAWASDCTKDVEQFLGERESPVMSPVLSCPDKTLVMLECHLENSYQNCKHDVVSSEVPSLEKCVLCYGPFSALKWIGLRCKGQNRCKKPRRKTKPHERLAFLKNADEGLVPRRKRKQQWSPSEVAAALRHFKTLINNGKLATVIECQQCKTAEHPALANRTVQNIRDFVRNHGISLKKKGGD
ncbi:uncharacterized protein [Thunnus thynnus]|uniref:uncharacterized protein isoform X1 n=1 Tax=Thunnus thynnus TaxID=8237 RepID=UPI003528C037